METLQSLRRQVSTTQSLHSVVRTMKALAAVSIRQYEQAAESLRDYRRTVELGFQALLRTHAGRDLLARPARREPLGIIVFGSDQGMCGQLNDQVAAHALHALKEHPSAEDQRYALVVGVRVAGRLEGAGVSVEEVIPVPDSAPGITESVQDLLSRISRWQSDRHVEEINLFFCRHLSGASYKPISQRLLPLDLRWLKELVDEDWPTRALPLIRMDADVIFSHLVREHLFVALHQAFAESLASENASRLASMQGAERNVEERLQELTRRFHQSRQIAITEELLDIISGFEGLRK